MMNNTTITDTGDAKTDVQTVGTGQQLDIRWQEPGGFIWLSIKNFLLKIITLGIYSFWGKTEVRRRIWNAIRINGEPLEYTGTGWELFKGFVLAVLIVGGGAFVYGFVLASFVDPASPLFTVLILPLYILFFWLIGLASYRTWRYRLRRTRWRGIRGTLSGSPVRYANLAFLSAFIVPLSFGWAHPWRTKILYERVTNETRIGNAHLQFEKVQSLAPLYKAFAWVWFSVIGAPFFIGFFSAFVGEVFPNPSEAFALSMVVVLMLAVFLAFLWVYHHYTATTMNWLAQHTLLHDGRFQLHLKAGEFLRLTLGNLLIALFSLGILLPVVQKRTVRHIVERLSFEGTVNLAAIGQAEDQLEKRGEGLGEFFDIDSF